jgi:ABC-type proline/glycine betaine transport system ATPase subunit
MNQGVIVAEGTPEEMLIDPQIHDLRAFLAMDKKKETIETPECEKVSD